MNACLKGDERGMNLSQILKVLFSTIFGTESIRNGTLVRNPQHFFKDVDAALRSADAGKAEAALGRCVDKESYSYHIRKAIVRINKGEHPAACREAMDEAVKCFQTKLEGDIARQRMEHITSSLNATNGVLRHKAAEVINMRPHQETIPTTTANEPRMQLQRPHVRPQTVEKMENFLEEDVTANNPGLEAKARGRELLKERFQKQIEMINGVIEHNENNPDQQATIEFDHDNEPQDEDEIDYGPEEPPIPPLKPVIKVEKKTGILGFILGAVSIIAGAFLCLTSAGFLAGFGAGLILNGIELIHTNIVMNANGTYDGDAIVKRCLTNVAISALAAGGGQLAEGMIALLPGGPQGLEVIRTFYQGLGSHDTIKNIVLQAAVRFFADGVVNSQAPAAAPQESLDDGDRAQLAADIMQSWYDRSVRPGIQRVLPENLEAFMKSLTEAVERGPLHELEQLVRGYTGYGLPCLVSLLNFHTGSYDFLHHFLERLETLLDRKLFHRRRKVGPQDAIMKGFDDFQSVQRMTLPQVQGDSGVDLVEEMSKVIQDLEDLPRHIMPDGEVIDDYCTLQPVVQRALYAQSDDNGGRIRVCQSQIHSNLPLLAQLYKDVMQYATMSVNRDTPARVIVETVVAHRHIDEPLRALVVESVSYSSNKSIA